jgi:DNA-binding MarR family transcriptional regulator
MIDQATIMHPMSKAPTPPESADRPASAAPGEPGFYCGERFRHEESVGWLMRQIMSSILLQADRRLAEHDLTHAQWVPLYKLAVGECTTMAELARALQLDPAAMTRALDRLEAKGLVQRVRSSSDRRVQNLELTDTGRQLAELVPAVLSDILNLHLAGFSHQEWRTLVDLLRRMRANGDALRQEGGA